MTTRETPLPPRPVGASRAHPARRLSLAPALLALAFVPAGCWYAETGGGGSRLRAPIVDRGIQPGPRTTDTGEAGTAAIGRTSIPRVASLATTPRRLPNLTVEDTPAGMRFVVTLPPARTSNQTAWIDLALPHGGNGDDDGVATLTAAVVVDAPRPSSGRGSLRTAIQAIGGLLSVHVDGACTHFTIGVPVNQWSKAVAELADAIAIAPGSAERIEPVQQAALVRSSEEHASDPTHATMRWAGSSLQLGRHPLDGMQDLTGTQLETFYENVYRARGAVLVVSVVDDLGRAMNTAKSAFAGWSQPAGPGAEGFPVASTFQPLPGVLWATGDRRPEAAILLQAPTRTGAEAAATEVAMEYLAGSDGRLPRMLREAMGSQIDFHEPTRFEDGPSTIVGLRTDVDAADAGKLFTALASAVGGLAAIEPSAADLRTAAARTRLRLLRELDDPSSAVRLIARRALASEALAPDDLQATITALEEPAQIQFRQASAAIVARPPTIVVVGGEPPRSIASQVVSLGRLKGVTEHELLSADDESQQLAGRRMLQLAIMALGGGEALRTVRGCSWQAETRSGRGPAAMEIAGFDGATRRFRRQRVVLATRIDTRITEDSAKELVGEVSIDLSPDAVSLMLERIERHPLLLLAATVRGSSAYRQISFRRIDGRSYAVLERVDAGRPRLRIYVDAESGLIREVESVEDLPGIGATSIREVYRDYRATTGARAPFHKTTWIGGTETGSTTTYLLFEPTVPPAELFER